MKKALVLVLSAILVLSLATVASAGVEIVGGQFALEYKYDLSKDDPVPNFYVPKGTDIRLNIEGKYEVGDFKGYAYSRFDFGEGKELKELTDARWYFKKAEMEYTLFDGFSLGLAYDKDDIKIYDEFVYDKKLKDLYEAVPMISTKYNNDMLDIAVFNNAYVKKLFGIVGVAKVNIEDAKVSGLFNFEQLDKDAEQNQIDVIGEASYTIDDLTFGAGVTYEKTTNKVEAEEEEYTEFKAVAKYLFDSVTLTGKGTYNITDTEFKKAECIVGYSNYELTGIFEPDKNIEVKGKIKNVGGSKDEIELKSKFGYDSGKEEFKKPALTAKYTFKF